jgi:uncharacterized membrane-anchored protein
MAHHNAPAPRLDSENVIVAAPMSFAGSAQRLWRLVPRGGGWVPVAAGSGIVLLIAVVWAVVLCWYVIFGLLLVPYRIIRRGQRKNRRQELRHREMLTTMHNLGQGHGGQAGGGQGYPPPSPDDPRALR